MPHVLIVDDSLTVRMDLQEAFVSAGFETTVCASVASATAAISEHRFSLVVLDILLPDGDGVELLARLKNDPATAAVPVMLLTTEAEVRDRVRGLATGADDYVGKPYDRAYILGRASQLVGTRLPEGGAQLLILDEDAFFAATLGAALEGAGYAVAYAGNGEEGLLRAVSMRPQALIVDGSPEGMIDGTRLIRRLKQDVALRHTPCVLLTATGSRWGELRALEAGADAYLRKESDPAAMVARISAVLRPGSTPSAATDSTSSLLSPKKILAIDDSATYLNALSAELRAEGYDIVLARSGEEALELLEVQKADCILLDVVMPGMSGYETCQRIKSRGEWQDIPLLMLTARGEREAMIEGINAGADDYVPKSSDFEVLRARLRAQLRRKQFEDENRRIRQELVDREVEATKARAAVEVAEARAVMSAELQRKNRELEAFSYSVSHDLRAPLRSIIGFSQILLEDHQEQLAGKAEDYLRRISSAGERMAQLIDDLLELSRVSRSELNRQRVDLSALAAVVAADIRRRDPEREVKIMVQDGMNVAGDSRLLRIVLENLIGNSWKFTGKAKSARIEIGAESDGETTRYFVRDNGAGFNMSYVERLFGPFQRLHSEVDFPGTGIGLATVYRIVERHGGTVQGEAAVGKGATFYFTLGAPHEA